MGKTNVPYGPSQYGIKLYSIAWESRFGDEPTLLKDFLVPVMDGQDYADARAFWHGVLEVYVQLQIPRYVVLYQTSAPDKVVLGLQSNTTRGEPDVVTGVRTEDARKVLDKRFEI